MAALRPVFMYIHNLLNADVGHNAFGYTGHFHDFFAVPHVGDSGISNIHARRDFTSQDSDG